MGGVRVRWRAVGKAAAIAAAGLAALALLPSLARPPVPPPLPRDVGLPRIARPARAPSPTDHPVPWFQS